MKIGIAGIGGIGSNVAVNLVRTGVKQIKFADFDRLDSSNLNRQFYFRDQLGVLKSELLKENLQRIDPSVHIESETLRFTKANISSFFHECPIIVEGFDTKPAKIMLLETLSSEKELIVSASGVAGTNLQNIQIRKLGSVVIIGDFESDVEQIPVYSPKVQMVAAMMSDVVLKFGGWYE